VVVRYPVASSMAWQVVPPSRPTATWETRAFAHGVSAAVAVEPVQAFTACRGSAPKTQNRVPPRATRQPVQAHLFGDRAVSRPNCSAVPRRASEVPSLAFTDSHPTSPAPPVRTRAVRPVRRPADPGLHIVSLHVLPLFWLVSIALGLLFRAVDEGAMVDVRSPSGRVRALSRPGGGLGVLVLPRTRPRGVPQGL